MGLLDLEGQEAGLEGSSDEEVLALSIKYPHQFEVLLLRYQDAFIRKAESIVRSTEEAEDITQEAFAKIYLNAARFKVVPGASFKSWGYRILINTALTHYRKIKRRFGQEEYLDTFLYDILGGKKIVIVNKLER